MAERRPLVRVGGQTVQMPMGDVLPMRLLYPKTYVDTASGNFTLPATALPDVDVLLVGGGTSGASAAAQRGEGGDSTLIDSAANVLLTAEGGKALRPGRGGGTAARHSSTTSTGVGATGVRGRFGYGCGGGAGPWESAGTGVAGSAGQSGTGDGGCGAAVATTVSVAGHGGGVVFERCALTPGDTYTHVLGAGGVRVSGTVGEPGGSGRIEYHYMDTVP